MSNVLNFSGLSSQGYSKRSSGTAAIGWWSIHALTLALLVILASPTSALSANSGALIVVGALGLWRWSWAGMHLVRAVIYERMVFPRIRRRASNAPLPSHLFIIVTSYRIQPEVTYTVYQRLIEELEAVHVPATIVSCFTDPADIKLVGRLFNSANLVEGSSIIFIPQAGRGKRHALGQALRVIIERHPPPFSFVALMDGDSALGRNTLRNTCEILSSENDVGAVTTENIPLVKGSTLVREWYRLRMAQRHSTMCSMSLSRRLLVLTGRFSVFRSEIATGEDFVQAVEKDSIPHWRLGTIEMLTGDDKSTWFTVLRRGWKMLYIPDAVVHPIEELPPGGVFSATTSLMSRWFGNMVRNSARAIALGPTRCGFFTWICLVDQRLSMWTPLVGPVCALSACMISGETSYLFLYLLWVLASRTAVSIALWAVTGRFHPLFAAIIYYNQIIGAWLKLRAVFSPHRQRWTRQAIGSPAGGLHNLWSDVSSNLLRYMSIAIFVVIVSGASISLGAPN
ncbi:glycosyltransferase [Microvirga pakistanensis]|uniref:glycosyltransferase n=1 Tax=Microvirga pakistanensis TaxID=1682650 RepID=UPI00106C1398|nr:glycosyltransferase [Microvirga pakistanensis]